MAASDVPGDDRRIRQIGCAFAFFWQVLLTAVFILCIYWTAHQDWFFKDVLREHFPVIVGLPMAGVVSFAIVVFLRQTDGPIEFEALGFKFKGAAGQVVMWILAFLTNVTAIKVLW